MKEMKIKLGLVLFGLLMIGCLQKNRIVNFSDVTKDSKIVLYHTDTTSRIYKINLTFKGEINGDALIYIEDGYNDKRKYMLNKGKVDYKIGGDWYTRKCIVNYQPLNVTKGSLYIEYEFFDF
jgi:hypothetical protein